MLDIPYNYRPPIAEYRPERPQKWEYGHWKRNGHYLQIRTHTNRSVEAYSKKPTNLTRDLRFAFTDTDWGQAVSCVAMDTILLGELFVPGKPASQVKSYIADQNPELEWECFAVAWQKDRGPHELARMPLEIQGEWLDVCGIPRVPFCTWVAGDNNADMAFKDEARIAKEVSGDSLEGLMLKESNLVGWTRYKPMKTIDLIVIGAVYAKMGKFGGQIGSLICATTEGYQVATVSGMNDADRLWWTRNIEDMKGSVIEVQYQCVEGRGKLRHANYIRLRDDKNASECSVNQDQELAMRHT